MLTYLFFLNFTFYFLLIVLGLVLLYWLWKYVLPTLTITASLSVTSGPSGTAFNVVVNSMNGTTPDANDTVVVTVTAPDKSTSSLTGTTDASGNATIATSAGALAGAYAYAVAVGGEAGPVLTFTQSLNPSLLLLQVSSCIYPEP